MDTLARQAREAHIKSQDFSRLSGQFRSQRDHLIRRLHAEGRSYGQLAREIGCSRDLVAKVVQRDRSRAV